MRCCFVLLAIQSAAAGRCDPAAGSQAQLDAPLWPTAAIQQECQGHSGMQTVQVSIIIDVVLGTSNCINSALDTDFVDDIIIFVGLFVFL